MVWGFFAIFPSFLLLLLLLIFLLLAPLLLLFPFFFLLILLPIFDLISLPTIDPRVFFLLLPVLYKITLVTTVSARQDGLIRPLGVLTSLGRTNRFNSLPSRCSPRAAYKLTYYKPTLFNAMIPQLPILFLILIFFFLFFSFSLLFICVSSNFLLFSLPLVTTVIIFFSHFNLMHIKLTYY